MRKKTECSNQESSFWGWRHGSSHKAPALQTYSLEFKESFLENVPFELVFERFLWR
jgi:hypothetical protein